MVIRTQPLLLMAASAFNSISASAIRDLGARNVVSAPSALYFKQLLVGKDFAVSQSRVHSFARQMNNFVYVVGDSNSREVMIIDGAWDPDGIEDLVRSDNMTVIGHIATHYHYDHIGGSAQGIIIPGIRDWAERKIPVYISSIELKMAAEQTGTDPSRLSPLEDGQCLKVGRFVLELIHTPGHSPGSVCILVCESKQDTKEESTEFATSNILLVTGDTVFPGSCGRLDLPGSDPHIMYDSLRKLANLPDLLPIYPGHGYNGVSSTIGAEKSVGLLRDVTRKQWEKMMVR